MNKTEFRRRETRTHTGLYAVLCLRCGEIHETTNPDFDALRSPCCQRGMAFIGHLAPKSPERVKSEDRDQMRPAHMVRSPVQREADQQEALFRWVQFRAATMPELKLLHHIPNGGRRDAAEAAHLKRLGVKPGVPDLCLPVARGPHHGLYIEMKAGDNKPTDKQNEWLDALRKQGYAIAVCWSHEEAEEVIEEYMAQGPYHRKTVMI